MTFTLPEVLTLASVAFVLGDGFGVATMCLSFAVSLLGRWKP